MKRLKNGLIRALIVGAKRFGSTIGLSRARRLGRVIGTLVYHMIPRERRAAVGNITRAFPELEPLEARQLVLATSRHLGESRLELTCLEKMSDDELRSLTVIRGTDHLRDAVATNRGVVIFSGHIGNWEWLAIATHLLGLRMTTVARKLYDERLNDLIVSSRSRFGVETIGRGSEASALQVMKTLRRGGILAVLIDQSIRAPSVLVPFFGIPAPTPVGPARIAIRAGALAIAASTRRVGHQIEVEFEEPIDTRVVVDPVELTAQMTRRIEDSIRLAPEQWVWIHRRWDIRSHQGIDATE